MNKIATTFGVSLLMLALIPNVQADTYKVDIKKIMHDSVTGDVVLLFKPGEKENGFSGKAKGVLLGTDPSANRSLATIFFAVSHEKEVIIEVETMPTSDVIQTITKVGFVP